MIETAPPQEDDVAPSLARGCAVVRTGAASVMDSGAIQVRNRDFIVILLLSAEGSARGRLAWLRKPPTCRRSQSGIMTAGTTTGSTSASPRCSSRGGGDVTVGASCSLKPTKWPSHTLAPSGNVS